MSDSKKNVLCFGANAYLAKSFFNHYQGQFNIIKIYRSHKSELSFDFENFDKIDAFAESISIRIDAIIFFQGINPSIGFSDMNYTHFQKMLNINVVVPSLLIKSIKPKMNVGCSILFLSSIAKKKGSFDPAYACAKSSLVGLMHSFVNACPQQRFNIVTLGLVENSPVHNGMSKDYIDKHTSRMYNGQLVTGNNVANMLKELILNESINRSEINIDGGFI